MNEADPVALHLWTTTLLVKNIHCPSCVSYAEDVLRPLLDIHKVDISMIDHTIRVQHSARKELAQDITQELCEAAFEVQHVSTRDTAGHIHYKYDLPESSDRSSSQGTWPWSKSMSKAERKHIENCNACKSKLAFTRPSKRSRRPRKWALASRIIGTSASKPTDLEKADAKSSISDGSYQDEKKNSSTVAEEDENGQHDAEAEVQQSWMTTIAIEGMTCAACIGTITKTLEPIDYVHSVNVNLLANNAIVQFSGPRGNVDLIKEAIEDAGYDATVAEVREISSNTNSANTSGERAGHRLTVSIEGMTCAACVGTITRGLNELPFISQANIDLMNNKGTIEFMGDNKTAILEKIDDLGYDVAELRCEQLDTSEHIVPAKQREVSVTVEGTYCPLCPTNIANALDKRFGTAVTIVQAPSDKSPRLTVKYTPSPPAMTVREIIATINAADEAFSASVYHIPSDEERSSEIRRRHRNDILWRLLLALVVAIPTFIIGIVYMSLVSKTNSTKVWFEEPVWAGSVTREDWALFIMTTPVMFYSANHFHKGALKDIWGLWRPKSKVPIIRRFYRFGSMNLLISLGTTVAYFSSLAILILNATTSRHMTGRSSDTYFDSVTFLTLFLLIGRFLEAYAKAKTGDAVNMLANLKPSEAYLIKQGNGKENDKPDDDERTIMKIPTDMLEVGDTVSVPHGASPPTDGTINQEGTFLFDESSLTGESKPVKKFLGDQVYAGSINVSHPVHVAVTELGGTSMLDKIVAVVRQGQGKRAPIERIADVITGYFAPVVTLIAIITWIVWLGLGEGGVLPRRWLDVQQGGWAFWSLEFAIAVFVVACPCGIGLAAPTALYVGGGLAAKNHILVQGGGEAFQEASKMDVVVFDKTGTLTEGKMQVTNFDMLQQSQDKPEDITLALVIAKALEDSSTHPIATAISNYCETAVKGSSTPPIVASEIQEVPGSGMTGTFTTKSLDTNQETIYEARLGNQRFETPQDNHLLGTLLSKYQNLGQSIAILSLRRKSDIPDAPFLPTALFSITDPLRPNTASVLHTLQQDHNLSIHMCTGDNATTARSIALQLGIPTANIRSNVLPHEKAEYIKSLQLDTTTTTNQPRRRIVAFIGDGTNDTPALSAADVSIALASGSDVAITQASFILLNSDLETILTLVKLAKRVFWRVKANFVWAAVYNVALIPVAAGVFFPIAQWRLGPVWASAAMALSSVSVVLSSLALRLPEVEVGFGGLRWGKRRRD
jgi:heavy metal translocating P-type ATPase